MIPTLVNDNAIELLKAQGKQASFRTAKDDAEFFSLLKQKLLSDIQKMSESQDKDKKLDFLIDAYSDLRVFMERMDVSLKAQGKDMKTEIATRLTKTGGFSKRIVIESVSKLVNDYTAEVEEIRKFGEEHGYPSMNIGRNSSGQVYMTLMAGKEAWEKQINSRRIDEGDSFFKLLEAVRRKDINEGAGETKTKQD